MIAKTSFTNKITNNFIDQEFKEIPWVKFPLIIAINDLVIPHKGHGF